MSLMYASTLNHYFKVQPLQIQGRKPFTLIVYSVIYLFTARFKQYKQFLK